MIKIAFRAASRLTSAALVCLLPIHAKAQNTSPWVNHDHSAVRLIAGSRSGPVFLGGIGFQLEPGWKTYWRTPGDSGVPPRIDFSKSENIEAVSILWPAPTKFADGAGGHSFGYQKQVVLPLRIVARNSDKPVILRASINYAVCEKICVPVEANTELTFISVASAEDFTLSAALDTVPKPSNIGDPNPITIRGVKRDGKSVHVEVLAPEAREVDLFVEGPTSEWALPVPKLLAREPGLQRFSFDLEGLPAGASHEGAALKLTLASGRNAYEYHVKLK